MEERRRNSKMEILKERDICQLGVSNLHVFFCQAWGWSLNYNYKL